MRHWAPPALPVLHPRTDADGRLLAAILVAAFAVRAWGISTAGIEHPDELFQYLEQANRLVSGSGVTPWEYRYGMRGGLMPVLLAGPMRLGTMVAPDASRWLAPRLLLAAISLLPVGAAWSIGRLCSRTHAAIAATAIAFWPDFVHFAPHALAEPLAVALLLGGAALATHDDPRRGVVAGLLIGLGAIVRFQYLPAAALLAWPAWRGPQRPRLIAGMALAVSLGAAADMVIGVVPFGWIVENIHQNLVLDRAARYGTAAPTAYLVAVAQLWGAWTAPVLALAACGARPRPSLALAALVTLGMHMLIPHKEYRFILLATGTIVLLAALGTGDLLARLPEATRTRWTGLTMLAWAVAAGTITLGGRAAALSPSPSAARTLFATLERDPAACGIALWKAHWSGAGGYSMLHKPIAIHVYAPRDDLAADARAFNRVIAPADEVVPGFTRAACQGGDDCLFARRGACEPPAAGHEINAWLAAHDE